ncbi:amino acid-binding protein [Solemya pervernicosa gill symbiont]|uniref:Amino acid-binding protein n=2 Tax=Gammaproteobacteria incertae sedis TaxID=118884 RepID=A0A1T2L637_9GAMM|nr:ACT domain-containing protein [Candidatus Reidiella endopervernicosa]OOZ40522.1 amino acid-binding protein [Solemya pervernicosa gill symbiont]QKQ27508.1 ACT domain-containing protein [Candidatus Reidiella endopervernicosa]
MSKWFMLTLVGKDRPGIVAHVTSALLEGGCNLGEASMMRLGANFTIMLMVQHDGTIKSLQSLISTEADSLGLHCHVDHVEGGLHQHEIPDVRISVYGADRAGIVAKVTTALAESGLNILDLESDVAGTEQDPIYIMHIEGHAAEGIESLQAALEVVCKEGIDASISPIETMIG